MRDFAGFRIELLSRPVQLGDRTLTSRVREPCRDRALRTVILSATSMQSLFEVHPRRSGPDSGLHGSLDLPGDEPRRRLVRRFLFGLLVLLSAAIGAAAGLLLVYSTDLPQVEQLERYRPSSVTELYDGQGRVIGTFALQRRVIATYEDYPPVLRD